MIVGIKVQVRELDAEVWAQNNNGPWPQDDKRALATAVRQDVRELVQHQLKNIVIFEELGIEVEVK